MILHVDMDAFYASVEERDCPQLRGRPVVVGGTPEGRGVVAAASYAARAFGVHSAMPAAQARRLCPQAVFVRPRMAHYVEVSRVIRRIFERFTPLVEPLSLDEAFLDVTASERLFGDAATIAAQIKHAVRAEVGLVASVGVAPTKFVAKVASDLDKPDGLVVVGSDAVQNFLDPLPVARLWGVGEASGQTIAGLGVRTICELRALPEAALVARLGEWGRRLAQLARGVDERPVVPDHEARSISHETTFARDLDDADALRAWLRGLMGQVAGRLRRQGCTARTVQIKLRYADFRTVTRAETLSRSTDATLELWRPALRLLRRQLGREPGALRLLGVGVSGIERGGDRQLGLFDDPGGSRERRIDEVVDEVSRRFGEDAIGRGGDPRGSR
jgi:DNA polymerase-4